MPDERRYPRATAEAVRSFLLLRLGMHLGLRQRNLRELLVCPRGRMPTSERHLEDRKRGELRWSDRDQGWEVLIPSVAFKNSTSSFFGSKPFRLVLPDLASLYDMIDAYLDRHRARLIGNAADPGTFSVKSVKKTSADASYNQNTFYEAWRLYNMLSELKVELVILDEIQRLASGTVAKPGGTAQKIHRVQTTEVTDTLKTMMIRGLVPMVFVGIPEAREHLSMDIQLTNREMNKIDFSPLQWSDPGDRVIFRSYCGLVGLTIKEHGLMPEETDFLEDDIPEKLWVSSGGCIGLVSRIAEEATRGIEERRENILWRMGTIEPHDDIDAVTTASANLMLGNYDYPSFMALVEAKLLVPDDDGRVPYAQLTALTDRFIFANEAGVRSRRGTGQVRSWLAAHGVQPEHDLDVKNGLVFDRAKVEPLLEMKASSPLQHLG